MSDDKQIPLWEQLNTDTKKSYEAFCAYRDMGHKRSLDKVAQALGKSKALMERWSTRHDWVNRVTVYDNYLDSKHMERMEQARVEVVENALTDYRELRKAIQKRFQTLEAVNYASPIDDLHDLITLITRTDDYVRRTVGLPEKITQSTNTNDNHHSGTVTLLSELSDDDLDSILND